MARVHETVTIPMRRAGRVAQRRDRRGADPVRSRAAAAPGALMDLFDDDPPPAPSDRRRAGAVDPSAPLAERMRPRTLDDIVGQEALLAPGRPLREAIERDRLRSIILWGPPGTGKTTLARVIASATRAHFIAFSAVLSGIKEIREVMAEAEQARRRSGGRTILFIDEIHRFNKAQQDAFLPRVESGDIVLIGATTENPSFEVNSALLSRSKVHVLKPLDAGGDGDDPAARARRRGARPRRARRSTADDEALAGIARYANGDARIALNMLEMAAAASGGAAASTSPLIADLAQNRALLYDKTGEEHYNLISALHKSMRNSDPDAAVYWLARMVEAGEDPLYVARRLVRFASEDVGNADPQALDARRRGQGRRALHRHARGQHRAGAGRDLSGDRAEEQRRLRGLHRGGGGGVAGSRRAGAAAPAQRADEADEVAGLREGLPVRPRRGGRGAPDMECLPPAHKERHVLPADRSSGFEARGSGSAARARRRRRQALRTGPSGTSPARSGRMNENR